MKKLLIITSLFIGAIGCGDADKKETSSDSSTTTSAAVTPDATATDTASSSANTANTTVVTPPMDSAAMKKAWQDYMTPGEYHQMLTKQNGNWKEEITMWMSEGAPAEKSTATCTNKMIFNGLYQESVHKGNFGGMPFEGHGTLGYDNAKKKFVSSWIDNMGTGIMYLEGSYDPSSKMVTLLGNCIDPSTGMPMDIRETMTIVDDKTMLMEMYDKKNGKERKSMEIRMTKM